MDFEFEQRSAQVHVPLHAELGELLHAVDLRQAAHVIEQHVGPVCLGLDQGGRKVRGIDRQHFRLVLAAEGFQIPDEAFLQRMAVRIVGRDEEKFLAEALDEVAGDSGGIHRGCITNTKYIPFAVRAGDRVGVAAGHDVEHLRLIGHLRHGVGDAGIHVTEDDIDLVALDQLAGFLHARADIVGGILDQEFHLATKNAVLFVYDFNRIAGTFNLARGECREDAGQRINHADADGALPTRGDDRRRGECREGQAGLQKCTPTKRRRGSYFHLVSLPVCLFSCAQAAHLL